MLEYVAALDEGARYAVLRHMARLPEPDMIADLREAVDAGVLAAVTGEPNTYRFADEAVRALALEEIGEERLAKLRARVRAVQGPVEESPGG